MYTFITVVSDYVAIFVVVLFQVRGHDRFVLNSPFKRNLALFLDNFNRVENPEVTDFRPIEIIIDSKKSYYMLSRKILSAE